MENRPFNYEEDCAQDFGAVSHRQVEVYRPAAPLVRLNEAGHAVGCRCDYCDPRPAVQQPQIVVASNGSSMLEKVVVLCLCTTLLVVVGLVILPMLIPILALSVMSVLAVAVALVAASVTLGKYTDHKVKVPGRKRG